MRAGRSTLGLWLPLLAGTVLLVSSCRNGAPALETRRWDVQLDLSMGESVEEFSSFAASPDGRWVVAAKRVGERGLAVIDTQERVATTRADAILLTDQWPLIRDAGSHRVEDLASGGVYDLGDPDTRVDRLTRYTFRAASSGVLVRLARDGGGGWSFLDVFTPGHTGPVWRKDLAHLTSGLAIASDGSLVFATTETESERYDTLLALRATDGEVVWAQPLHLGVSGLSRGAAPLLVSSDGAHVLVRGQRGEGAASRSVAQVRSVKDGSLEAEIPLRGNSATEMLDTHSHAAFDSRHLWWFYFTRSTSGGGHVVFPVAGDGGEHTYCTLQTYDVARSALTRSVEGSDVASLLGGKTGSDPCSVRALLPLAGGEVLAVVASALDRFEFRLLQHAPR